MNSANRDITLVLSLTGGRQMEAASKASRAGHGSEAAGAGPNAATPRDADPGAEPGAARPYAALTPKGEKLMEEIFPEHAVMIERAVAGLDAAEQERAIMLLRKLGTSVAP